MRAGEERRRERRRRRRARHLPLPLVFATPALCDSGTDAAKKKEPSDVRCRVVELNPKPGGPSSEEAEDPSSDPGSEEAEPGNAAREEL